MANVFIQQLFIQLSAYRYRYTLKNDLHIYHVYCTCAFYLLSLAVLLNTIWAHRNNILRQRLGQTIGYLNLIQFVLGIFFAEYGNNKQQQQQQQQNKN